jgi:hypothetical protein
VATRGGLEPLYVFEMCDAGAAQDLPVLGLFAGVHGIEAIGVKILHRFLDHVLEQTDWNENVRLLLKRVRVVGAPLVNPAGYVAGTRCNGNGVDLMRNAPVESAASYPFVGGQRFSNLLPYFRGNGPFEKENEAVLELVREVLFEAPFAVSLDIHSGFGMEDFLWTPWARAKGFPPHWAEYTRFSEVLDRALKHHIYRFEPQSVNYCTSGDLWDYLFAEANARGDGRLFLPLTLEVGSWVWLKKSPRSAFRLRSFFNPMQPHRERRVLRRHLPLLNLLVQAVADYERVFLGRVQAGARAEVGPGASASPGDTPQMPVTPLRRVR